MKILHVIHRFVNAERRGSEIYTYDLCRSLAGRHDVAVLHTSPENAAGRMESEQVDGLPTFVVGNAESWEEAKLRGQSRPVVTPSRCGPLMQPAIPMQHLRVSPGRDTTVPDTTITASPAATTNSTSASFSFASTEANSTFACSLDSSAFSSCTSPTRYSVLLAGIHTFQVQATDLASNVDPTPASYIWTIQ